MGVKGLCIACVKDKGCTFTKRYPVVQCEEFTEDIPRPAAARGMKQRKTPKQG